MPLLDEVWHVVSKGTAWLVVIADENTPRPPSRHATIRAMTAEVARHPIMVLHQTNPTLDKLRTNPHSVIEVQFFGKSANEEAAKFSLRLGTRRVQDELETRNLALGRKLGVQNVTAALAASEKEERATVEFEVLHMIEVDDDNGSIESVELQTEADTDGDGMANLTDIVIISPNP